MKTALNKKKIIEGFETSESKRGIKNHSINHCVKLSLFSENSE